MPEEPQAEAPEAQKPPPVDPPVDPGPDPEPPPLVLVTDPPPPQNDPPTQAQSDWMLANPQYVTTPHDRVGRFSSRGTLMPDGTFIPATQSPIIDGNGAFGVGIPV